MEYLHFYFGRSLYPKQILKTELKNPCYAGAGQFPFISIGSIS